ncbi:hypothetical protein SAMN05444714_0787 [Yoonia litorea]|uniref:Uncharacterized protein n=1 Tax=Yoonia litorea TaxID=1123755 RepID=A0A1I6LQP4_9RHOB|nr:hypothetical protein SAMN05444714_0787 [Yoonia litorea]
MGFPPRTGTISLLKVSTETSGLGGRPTMRGLRRMTKRVVLRV